MIHDLFVREALLQEPIDHKVRCKVCERRCVLVAGGLGWCRARANSNGRLVTLIYRRSHPWPSIPSRRSRFTISIRGPRHSPPGAGRAISPAPGARTGISAKWRRLAPGRHLYNTYVPAYRFSAPPTPVETLERAWRLGKEAGLEFVYTGNVPGHRYDNTYCPGCGTLLIRRWGFDVRLKALQHGRCPRCGREVAGVWENGAPTQ